MRLYDLHLGEFFRFVAAQEINAWVDFQWMGRGFRISPFSLCRLVTTCSAGVYKVQIIRDSRLLMTECFVGGQTPLHDVIRDSPCKVCSDSINKNKDLVSGCCTE